MQDILEAVCSGPGSIVATLQLAEGQTLSVFGTNPEAIAKLEKAGLVQKNESEVGPG